MTSRWQRAYADDQHVPVEMRFIDMFMTALGSLVFLAMLLMLLPHNPPANRVPKELYDGVVAENQRLKGLYDGVVAEMQRLRAQLAQREDKDIVKRWFGVQLVTFGCGAAEPELYVRWEGSLIDDNGNPNPDARPFDSASIPDRTTLIGYKYVDIGNGTESTANGPGTLAPAAWAGLDAFKRNGLNTKQFYGVARANGSYSVYAGFRDPSTVSRECEVHPYYLSFFGVVPGEKIVMSQQRPFAWLRRFKMNLDGTTTFGISPRSDEEFVRQLAEFSRQQSQILCVKKSICETVDAHYAVIVPPAPTPPAGAKAPLSQGKERALKPKDSFTECANCPEMVVVPAGSFIMGSPDDQKGRSPDEGPQHTVAFESPFAVGQFAVTFDEWDACVSDGGCAAYRPADQGWGRGRRPVINVSWNDAEAYVDWLSRKTGRTYRLLTEAEREYVARAGTTSPFWWGTSVSTQQANYDGRFVLEGSRPGAPRETRGRTGPVDGFTPNQWGLWQVHGNVWEWTEDCQNGSYDGAPADGSARLTGDCGRRMLRGGSWTSPPRLLRAAARLSGPPEERDNNNGFRVARTLPLQAVHSVGFVALSARNIQNGKVVAFANFSLPPGFIISTSDTISSGVVLKARSKTSLWGKTDGGFLRLVDEGECFEVRQIVPPSENWAYVKGAVCSY